MLNTINPITIEFVTVGFEFLTLKIRKRKANPSISIIIAIITFALITEYFLELIIRTPLLKIKHVVINESEAAIIAHFINTLSRFQSA